MSLQKEIRFQLAKRLDGVSESATLKLNSTVQQMKAKGVDIVNLTAGEPDFFVPEVARQAVTEAMNANRSKYTPVPGIPELREAVAAKTNRQHSEIGKTNPWKASNVIITNGGKQALFNTFMASLDPGDEVLIPTPHWLSYPEMVKLAGGIPKFISASFSEGFKIRPEQLKNALGPKVKFLILNSPSNPTGALYSKQEYRELAEILLNSPGGENVWVVSDEIYDRIILGRVPFCSFLDAAPELKDRTVTVNGMSKSTAMTGWRIGWSVAPEILIQGMITLQGQSTSGVNALAQWASLAALKLPETYFSSQIESYKKRCNLLLENLRKTRKMEISAPEGAFYAFVGIGPYLRPGEDSIAFAQRLLEDARVAVIPGTPFGEPEFIRLSFATDEKSISEGCRRILDYLE
jgi:aspartate aminotransferase